MYFVNPDTKAVYQVHSQKVSTQKGKVSLILLKDDQEESDVLDSTEVETWPIYSEKTVDDAVSCILIANNEDVDHFNLLGETIDIDTYRSKMFATIPDWDFVEQKKTAIELKRYGRKTEYYPKRHREDVADRARKLYETDSDDDIGSYAPTNKKMNSYKR